MLIVLYYMEQVGAGFLVQLECLFEVARRVARDGLVRLSGGKDAWTA